MFIELIKCLHPFTHWLQHMPSLAMGQILFLFLICSRTATEILMLLVSVKRRFSCDFDLSKDVLFSGVFIAFCKSLLDKTHHITMPCILEWMLEN